MRFENFTALMFEVEVLWVVTPCSVVGYRRFGGPCCLHLYLDGHLERWYPTTTLHPVTTQKNSALKHHRRENLKVQNFTFVC